MVILGTHVEAELVGIGSIRGGGGVGLRHDFGDSSCIVIVDVRPCSHLGVSKLVRENHPRERERLGCIIANGASWSCREAFYFIKELVGESMRKDVLDGTLKKQ